MSSTNWDIDRVYKLRADRAFMLVDYWNKNKNTNILILEINAMIKGYFGIKDDNKQSVQAPPLTNEELLAMNGDTNLSNGAIITGLKPKVKQNKVIIHTKSSTIKDENGK